MAEQLLQNGPPTLPNEGSSSPTDTGKLDGLAQICGLFLPAHVPAGQDKNDSKRSNSLQGGDNAKKAKTSHEFGSPVPKVEKHFKFGDASSTNFTAMPIHPGMSHYDPRMPSNHKAPPMPRQPLHHPPMVTLENVNALMPSYHYPGILNQTSSTIPNTTSSLSSTFPGSAKVPPTDGAALVSQDDVASDPIASRAASMLPPSTAQDGNMVYAVNHNSSHPAFIKSGNVASSTGDSNVAAAKQATQAVPAKPGPVLFSPSKKERIRIEKEEVNNQDVICGRGFKASTHPGNVEHLQVVKEYAGLYENFGAQHGEKTKLSNTLVSRVTSKGGRFLVESGKQYHLLTREEARVKVGQALRDYLPVSATPTTVLALPTKPPANATRPTLVSQSTIGHNGAVGMTAAASRDNRKPPSRKDCFSPSTTFRILVRKEEITNNDILCGREYAGSDHPGNLSYLQMVNDNKARHHELGCQHGEKTKIRNMIVDELVDRGGKFVRKTGEETYHLLTLQEARSKVSQSLREKKK